MQASKQVFVYLLYSTASIKITDFPPPVRFLFILFVLRHPSLQCVSGRSTRTREYRRYKRSLPVWLAGCLQGKRNGAKHNFVPTMSSKYLVVSTYLIVGSLGLELGTATVRAVAVVQPCLLSQKKKIKRQSRADKNKQIRDGIRKYLLRVQLRLQASRWASSQPGRMRDST